MKATECLILFPDQLFEKKFYQVKNVPVFLVKDELFFKQFLFHKQKIIFHLETIKKYQEEIKSLTVVESIDEVLRFLPDLKKIYVFEVRDNWLEKKINKFVKKNKIQIESWSSPSFLLNKSNYLSLFPPEKNTYRLEFFYQTMRKSFNILMSDNNEPAGGRWNYDSLNRKKWPNQKNIPKDPANFYQKINFETKAAIEKKYQDNYGADGLFFYVTGRNEVKKEFTDFLTGRFSEFGPYEDSIVASATRLNHSMLSMYLNVGLITPKEIIELVQDFYGNNPNSLSSVEGFIRQIIGWREFVAGIYEIKGSRQRNKNFFNHHNKLPNFFWTGNSGLLPFDDSWEKLNKYSYVHHIERLMIFGNLMLLLEIDPSEVYDWFMTFFIDAYDWVMVPNVYGMSQFADGGMLASKPYISSSNYILKMSNYNKGDWADIWDGLYWGFIKKNRIIFANNPRMSLMAKTLDKISTSRFNLLHYKAEQFKEKIWTN